MKLSKKQDKELKILRYWIPSGAKFNSMTGRQVEDFFAWSDRGIPHGRNVMVDRDFFTALYWAKNRRDLQITSYLQDWGETVNAWSFSEEPEYIVEDIAKRMKKPSIMQAYQGIL